jgi:RHS repeat-associated protein
MFLESLETRDLLATVAVFPDIIEVAENGTMARWKIVRSVADSSSLTVNFSISGTATAGFDYQTITPTSVTIPANEDHVYLELHPINDIWWEPEESVVLVLEPGSYTIGQPSGAALGIVSDDVYPPELAWLFRDPFSCNCPCTCGEDISSATNAAGGNRNTASNAAGTTNSSAAASRHVTVSAKATFTQQAAQATRIDVTSSLGGQQGPTAYFSGGGIQAGQEYEISIPIDTESLGVEDGLREWQFDVVEHYPMSPDITRSASGAVKVIGNAGGEFGSGWLPSDVDRLVEQTSGVYQGVLWIRGDYNAYWFEKVGSSYFRQAGEPDYSTLTRETDGSFTLRKKTGESLHFVDTGTYHMLATRTDRNGNVTSYTYTNADGEDGADEILTITRPGGLLTTYTYDPLIEPMRVTSITDPYGRVTDLRYSAGNLTSIKEPDPDGVGPLTRPETGFSYNGDKQIASITDAEGNTTSFTYVQKLIRTVTHPGGGVETYKVAFGRALEDGLGSIGTPRPMFLFSEVKTEYKNELNHTWYFTFNLFGNALTVTNPQGKVTSYQINLENLVTSRTDPDPDDGGPQGMPVTTYEYDTRLNLARITYPDGSIEAWGYDPNFSRLTIYQNRRGKFTTFTVDPANGNHTQITQVNQQGTNDSVWNFTYTGSGIKGLVLTVIDPRTFQTSYTRNGHGLVTSIEYAVGTADAAIEEFGYDAFDNLAWFEDGLDRRTDYLWDALDRLISITLPDPDGGGPLVRPIYTYEYNKNNYLKKETDPLSHVTEYVYNGRLDVVEVKQPDPDGTGPQTTPITTYAYDLHRRNTSITDPLGRVTAFTYDSLDRLMNVTLPDPDGGGSQTSSVYGYTYDHIHRVKQITDPLSNVTLLDNGTWNRIAATLPDPDGGGPLGSSTTVDLWDSEGNYSSHTDELTYTSGYTYDDLGRVSQLSLPGSIVTQFGYDKSSNVTSVNNPRGYQTTYQYDGRNRVTTETSADPDGTGPLTSPVTTYTYNDANELVTVTDPRGFVTAYTYDGLGRLKTVTEADPDGGGPATSPVWTYSYDAASRLVGILDPQGNLTQYVYDDLDRVTSVIEADPDDGGPLASPTTSFTYDLVGNLLSVTDPISRVTSYQYDGLDRLTSVTEPSPGGTTSYAYDKVNNVLSVTDARGYTTSYVYDNRYFLSTLTQPAVGAGVPVTTYEHDAVGQVTKVIDPLSRQTSYVYDGLGRITSVTRPDPDGGGNQTAPVTAYAYDANSNLTSFTDPRGNVTGYEYDRLDRLTKFTRPDPDAGGPAAGPITSYAYDASSNLTGVTDPLSRVTVYAYDGLNRRTSATQPDPDGGGGPLTSPVTSFAYDKLGNVTGITDPRGNVTSRTLDNLYRQIQVTQADPDAGGPLTSSVTSFVYDAASQLLSVTDPMSRVTNYEYNGLGLNSKIIEPDPDAGGPLARPETTMGYDALGNLLSVTDPLSHTTSYLYDALSRNTRITDANSGQTNFGYDKVGNLLTLTDPVNNTTTWAYDALDRATSETNQLGHARTFAYDPADNLIKKTDRNGRITEYVYDNLDRNTQEIWIDDAPPAPSVGVSTTTNGSTQNEVQTVGYTSVFIQSGWFTLTYDGQTTGQIAYNATAATVQSALEALSNIGVGDVSVVKTQNSSASQQWQITFQGSLANTNVPQTTIDATNVVSIPPKFEIEQTDVQGSAPVNEVQVVTLSNATGGTFTLSFGGQSTAAIARSATAATVDAALEALSTIDTVTVTGGNGGPWTVTFTGSHSGVNVAQLTGNAAGLVNYIPERTLSYTYDAADQLTAASDPAAAYAYVYDNLGRVTQQTQTIAGLTPSIVLAQKFDAASNRTELSATIGGTADFKNTYVYDGLNRMTQVIQQGQGGGNAVAVKRVDLTYNAAGQFDVISRYQSTNTSAPVATSHFGYDGMGRLKDLDHKTNGGATTLASYDYTYDAASRITSVTSLGDGLSSFTYDVTNQLTAADHASQPDESYSFDLNGNRTMAGYSVGSNNRLLSDGVNNYTYDNEGNRISRTNISTGEQTLYEWDHRNRLVKVTEKDEMGSVVATTENTYDAFDHWIRRSFDEDGPGGNSPEDTFFVYDENQSVLEFEGADANDLSHRYLWGPDVDQFFADEQVNSLSSAGNPLWGLGDHQGTLRDIADRHEGTGVTTVTNHRKYETFGTRVSETNSSVDLIFGYTSRLFDETTGLQDNWHRPYDSKTGSWPTPDPWGFNAGDANLHRYATNDPVNHVDPSGLVSPGKGNHYVPKSVFEPLRKWLSDEAYNFFMSGSGTLNPELYIHRYDTWNGVTHGEYIADVRYFLNLFIKKKGCKLTEDDAKLFYEFIRHGKKLAEFSDIDDPKFAEALARMSKWLTGFHASAAIAKALTNDLGVNLTPEEMKQALKIIINKEKPPPGVSPKVVSAVRKWAAVGQATRSSWIGNRLRELGGGVFRWAGKIFIVGSVVTLWNAAAAGYAGEHERFPDKCGFEGAYHAFAWTYMEGEFVEGYVFPTVELLAADLPAAALGLPEDAVIKEFTRNGVIIGEGGEILGFTYDPEEVFGDGKAWVVGDPKYDWRNKWWNRIWQ